MHTDGADYPRDLGGLEFEVMEVLWSHGELSVRAVLPLIGRPRAYTTVMTALDRLYEKKFVQRRREGQTFFYTPRFSRDEWTRRVVGRLIAMSQSVKPPTDAASFLVDVVCHDDEFLLQKLLDKIEGKRRELDERRKP